MTEDPRYHSQWSGGPPPPGFVPLWRPKVRKPKPGSDGDKLVKWFEKNVIDNLVNEDYR